MFIKQDEDFKNVFVWVGRKFAQLMTCFVRSEIIAMPFWADVQRQYYFTYMRRNYVDFSNPNLDWHTLLRYAADNHATTESAASEAYKTSKP